MQIIGGVTLHSFAGIGAGDAGLQRCYDLASRTASAQTWRKCKRLIIDEISMVDGEFFEVSDSMSSTLHFNGLLIIIDFIFFLFLLFLTENRSGSTLYTKK